MLDQLKDLVVVAEQRCASLKETSKLPDVANSWGEDKVIRHAAEVEAAGGQSKTATKACTDLILLKKRIMSDALRQELVALLGRINECARATEVILVNTKEARKKAQERKDKV